MTKNKRFYKTTMSIRVGRDEAEQRFSELLAQVSKGEEVEIISEGKEIVRLVPSSSTHRNKVAYTRPSQSEIKEFFEVAVSEANFKLPPNSLISPTANRLSNGEDFEPLENQTELDEILDNISLVQARMKEDRLEISASIRNIDNMLTLIED